MRDRADNVVIVCSIENVDPMGVHTGDSVTVAPQMSLTDRQYQMLRDQAIAVIRAVGVETGGSNVQFAVNPATDEIVVIEMNPRVSRSSALASKATGFPIAKIAARLAVGYTLDEIPNDITRATPASFEPTIDYVVVKWPRFAFEKFPGVDARLSTHMKSRRRGDGDRAHVQAGVREGDALARARPAGRPGARRPARRGWRRPAPTASTSLLEAFRQGATEAEVHARTVDRPVVPARAARARARPRGASDGVRTFRAVDTCAAEFAAETPYFYSALGAAAGVHEVPRGDRPSVMILGSGPNRIGQGIEFDYCCVHAAMTVRESGRDAVMVNCNPETVSTDYDTSDRLYFEPLTLEDVLGIVEVEQPEGVIVQFGGQTPLKLAAGPGGGGRAAARHLAGGDRPRRGPRPLRRAARAARAQGAAVRDRARARGRRWPPRRGVGFPLLVRPSYVLGGRAMELVYSTDGLARLPAPRPARTDASRDLPRPLPGERDRGRRRRDLRRRGRLDRRRSCSTSRRPGSTPATRPACCRRTRSAPRCCGEIRDATTRARARARRRRADERAVRACSATSST